MVLWSRSGGLSQRLKLALKRVCSVSRGVLCWFKECLQQVHGVCGRKVHKVFLEGILKSLRRLYGDLYTEIRGSLKSV